MLRASPSKQVNSTILDFLMIVIVSNISLIGGLLLVRLLLHWLLEWWLKLLLGGCVGGFVSKLNCK